MLTNGDTRDSMKLDIGIDKSTAVKCPKCNGTTFNMVYLLRELSKILTGGPRALTIPIPIWKCDNCNTLLNRDLPAGIGTFEEITNSGVAGVEHQNHQRSALLGTGVSHNQHTGETKLLKID